MLYFEHEQPRPYSRQLARLLRDESTDNTALVLSLIEGGEADKRVKGYLFGLAVFHHEAEQAGRALGLLKQCTDAETVRQAEKLRIGSSYYYNEAEYLGKFQNAEIDLFDFLLAYKMCHWHRHSGARNAWFITAHQTLNLQHYPHKYLGAAFEQLDFIRYLALPTHKDFDLAASFSSLLKLPLETIFIENTKLDEFPVLLLELPNLRALYLKRGANRPRQPMTVPEGGPYGSHSLQKLVIDGYPIAGEMRLGPFPCLQEANLTKCSLSDLSFLHRSSQLEVLQVKNNFIECIPSFLSDFQALRILDFSFNPLLSIDLNLEKLTYLEKMDIKIERKPSQTANTPPRLS